MAHNLILNYGLDKEMNILRPAKATAHNMTAFHTDEYIDFLSTVMPETVAEQTGNGTRCESKHPALLVAASQSLTWRLYFGACSWQS